MHLFNCIHPVKVSLYGEIHYVPCEKCDYCRYVRSLGRSSRLTDLLSGYKYGYFVTLTYHDAFLPLCSLNEYNSYIYYRTSNYNEVSDGLCSDLPKLSDDDIELAHRIIDKYGGIPVLNRYDIQTFMKRLRINITRTYEKENLSAPQIKYGYCGEYGPSTYRPHYHLLFGFDDEKLFRIFPSLIRKNWSYGIATIRIFDTKSEDASYVARYANAIHRLPGFLQPRLVAPFFSSSKAVTFVSVQYSKEAIEKAYRDRTATLVRKEVDGTSSTVPLPLHIENRLYPRFSGFGRLNYRCVYDILRKCEQPEIKSPRDYMLQFLFDAQTTCHYDIGCYYDLFLKGYHPTDRVNFLTNVAKSIWYCHLHYKRLCEHFNISLSEAVQRTFDYTYNKAMFQLKSQFEFEDTFYSKHPDWLQYIHLAPCEYTTMCNTEFGIALQHAKNNIEHSHKNKRKRDYLSAHPEYSYIDKYDDNRLTFAPYVF